MGYSFNDFIGDLQPVGVGIQNIIGNEQKMTTSIFGGLFSTVGSLGNNLSSTLSSLSLPLVLLGGGILLITINKK
jgi:hypothetical protein